LEEAAVAGGSGESGFMKTQECDLLVIGGGPGGYTAAMRAAQGGLSVLLVERGPMGGTCLNRGCLPTKTLLEDTRLIDAVRRAAFLKGDLRINRVRILARKDAVVEVSVAGITQAVLEKGVGIVKGAASFTAPGKVVVDRGEEEPLGIEAAHVIIATGSRPEYGPGLTIDGNKILDTDAALALETIPRSIAIVGSGNRGVEFASIYANLGTRVTIVEKEKRLLPREHRWIGGRYRQALGQRHIQVMTRTEAVATEPLHDQGVRLVVTRDDGESERLDVDRVLLTGSRRPCFDGLNLDVAGLDTSGGFLTRGETMETGQQGVYVVGDAAGPPYLAHKAIAQSAAVVDRILGKPSAGTPVIANCVYGDPEVGSVGMTDYEAKKAGYPVRLGEFYFARSGRAASMGKDDGFVLIPVDEESGKVLGMHILGPSATELISLGVLAIQNGLTIEDLRRTVLPHMTLSESVYEAAAALTLAPSTPSP